MLRLLIGTDWVANRDRVLSLVAQQVQQRIPGGILLVPELISHDMERRLSAQAGDTASRYAQVVSFSRLVRLVSEQTRQAPGKCLDNGGRQVAMAAAARQLTGKLKSYAALQTRPEFLSGLVDAVDEFKRCCITSADLRAAARESQGTLAQKLEELSDLLECYDSLCARGKRDPRDQMNWVLEQMEAGEFARDRCFYIDGFPDFTRQHLAILEYLIASGAPVTISLNCDVPGTSHAAFETAGRTANEVLRLAEKAGVPVEVVSVAPTMAPPLEYLCTHLLQGKLSPQPELKDYVTVTRCESEYAVCLAAAESVRELVQQGYRYREIAVALPDPAANRAVLELAFHQCGIPLYLSGTEDILQKSAIHTLLCALEAALGGLESGSVLRYLKSQLSPLAPEVCDKMENYTFCWGIQGNQWRTEWTAHPFGLGQEWDEAAKQALQELNQARQLAIAPLGTLRDALRGATSLGQQVQAVWNFLQAIAMDEQLEALAAQADAMEENPRAQELNQLWEILVGALEQLSDVLGDCAWPAEGFVSLLRLLLSQYDVGTIPPVLDAVTAGPISAMRCQQARVLLVLGASEGSLPSYAGSTGVLSDQERVALRKLGLPLTGGAMEGVAAELAEIYGVFCGGREKILLSTGSGQSALVYRRICTMLDAEDGTPCVPGPGPGLYEPWQAGAWLAARDGAEEAGSLGLEEAYRDAKQRSQYTLGNITPAQLHKLYGNRLILSASQIDQQAQCRLAYFLRYGLRAKERKKWTVDPAEFGTYVHAVLEQTAREIQSLGGWHEISLEQTLELAHRYADAYAQARFSQLESERMQYLFRRNAQELDAVVAELWQELSKSLFEPVAFELSFGPDAQMPEVSTPGQKMDAVLRGFVDRVDQWKDAYHNYFRVVDYKTGKKDFDYCDVANGVGLQMLLYLFALAQGGQTLLSGQAIGAGVQYFPARFPLVSADGRLTPEQVAQEREKQLRRRGLILHDDDVVWAMEPSEELHKLSCKRKKDGSLTGDVATREQLKQLEAYVFWQVGQLVDQIASGEVSPNPYTRGSAHSACAFCPYGPVCALSREAGRRNYKTMTAQQFWEEIERQVQSNG